MEGSLIKISLWIYLLQIIHNYKCDFQLKGINKVRLSFVVTTKTKSQWLSVTKVYFLLTLHIDHRSEIPVSQGLRPMEAPLAYSYTIWNIGPPRSLQKGNGELEGQTLLAFFSMKVTYFTHNRLTRTSNVAPPETAGYLESCRGACE